MWVKIDGEAELKEKVKEKEKEKETVEGRFLKGKELKKKMDDPQGHEISGNGTVKFLHMWQKIKEIKEKK